MSLIHDNPWLVDQLLQTVASEDKAKLSKTAQLDPATQQAADALRSALNNLRDQITPLKESPDRISHSTGVADLSSNNLDSMGDLVQWLAAHGTKVGGNVVVYPGTVEPPNEDYRYYRIEPGTEIVVPMAKSNTTAVGYLINADALKAFLVSLQADTKLKSNVVFQVQLLKLIQDANKQLQIDVSESYHAPEKPDNYPLDQVPKVLVSGDSKPGTELLTYGDLKSTENLVSWLTGHDIGLGEAGNTLRTNPDKFDLCAAVNVLFYRAQRHATLSARPEDTERFKIYSSMLRQSAPPSCQLTGSGQSPQSGSGGGGGGGSGIAPGDMSILRELAGEQIFDVDSIDLNKIAIFADKYAAWANRPDINELRDKIHSSIGEAQKYLSAPGIIQVTNMNINEFRNLAKNGNMARLLATTLDTVITYAGRMVTDLVNNVLKRTFGAQSARNLEQQVARGGAQQSNLMMLQQMAQLAGTPGPRNY